MLRVSPKPFRVSLPVSVWLTDSYCVSIFLHLLCTRLCAPVSQVRLRRLCVTPSPLRASVSQVLFGRLRVAPSPPRAPVSQVLLGRLRVAPSPPRAPVSLSASVRAYAAQYAPAGRPVGPVARGPAGRPAGGPPDREWPGQ